MTQLYFRDLHHRIARLEAQSSPEPPVQVILYWVDEDGEEELIAGPPPPGEPEHEPSAGLPCHLSAEGFWEEDNEPSIRDRQHARAARCQVSAAGTLAAGQSDSPPHTRRWRAACQATPQPARQTHRTGQSLLDASSGRIEVLPGVANPDAEGACPSAKNSSRFSAVPAPRYLS